MPPPAISTPRRAIETRTVTDQQTLCLLTYTPQATPLTSSLPSERVVVFFWQWSDDGCYLGVVTNDSVQCFCSHLTSFATLMDINGIIQEGSVSYLLFIGLLRCVKALAKERYQFSNLLS